MHENSQTSYASLSPLPLSLTAERSKPCTLHRTPSSTLKVPSNKFTRRSFTPIGLNDVASPAYTPIKKSSTLDSSVDFLNDSMTPKNASLCSFYFNSANRNNCFTPQQSIGKTIEKNKTFTIRNNKVMKKKIDANDRASIKRALHLSMDSPLAIKPSKSPNNKYEFSPIGIDERPPTPMPKCNDAQHSSTDLTFIENILDQSINIATILKEVGMEKYIEKFEREEIDLLVFSMLKSDDLAELGIEEADRPAIVRAFYTYRDVFGNVDI